MAIDDINQDEGVLVAHTRCGECGDEMIGTIRNPDLFPDDHPYQPLLIPHEDVCGPCFEAEWARIQTTPEYLARQAQLLQEISGL